jgi:hypothetical protein
MGQINFTTERINELLTKVQNIELSDMFKVRGTLNVTDQGSIIEAQDNLANTGSVGIYLVTDSRYKIPSKDEQAITITSEVLKQLSLTSPDNFTDGLLSAATKNVSLEPIGVNVGDIIALTRVDVKVADLASALGVSLPFSGEIELYQFKLWSTNDAKATYFKNSNGVTIPSGASGLMSPWDKTQVNKIPNIEPLATNALPKVDRLPTHNVWDSNMDTCFEQGIYPWCLTGRPFGSSDGTHYTLVVQKSSTSDNSGYYTITQTCYGREGTDFGKIFQRILFRRNNGDIDWGKGWVRLDSESRIDTIQQRITGLEEGMSPFYYPFVSLGHIGGSGTSATQELLNQVLDDLVDSEKRKERGGVFRALYNGSQIIIEQYATDYKNNRFIQVVRGSIGIDPSNTMKVGFRAYEFNMLYRIHNGAVDGFTEWMAMPTATTIAKLEARIKALENK